MPLKRGEIARKVGQKFNLARPTDAIGIDDCARGDDKSDNIVLRIHTQVLDGKFELLRKRCKLRQIIVQCTLLDIGKLDARILRALDAMVQDDIALARRRQAIGSGKKGQHHEMVPIGFTNAEKIVMR